MVPESAYRRSDPPVQSRNEEIVQNAINNMHEKWAKSAGTEDDPMYKLIEEGKINNENLFDILKQDGAVDFSLSSARDFQNRLEEFGYRGAFNEKAEGFPHWYDMLDDFRSQQGLPRNIAEGEAYDTYNYYDAELLAPNPDNRDLGKFLSKDNFEYLGFDGYLAGKEKKFFDKLDPEDMVAVNLQKYGWPIFDDTGKKALLHALEKGRLTPSSLDNNRISISGLVDFIEQHRDDLLAEGMKVPPEDILNTFDSGHRWEELKKRNQLQFEGKKMSNCVGSYCDKVERGDSRIFSLRNAEGTPKITAEWDPRTRTFSQIYGPANSPPKEKYLDMIDWLTNKSIDW